MEHSLICNSSTTALPPILVPKSMANGQGSSSQSQDTGFSSSSLASMQLNDEVGTQVVYLQPEMNTVRLSSL